MIDLSTIPAFPGSTTRSRHWSQPGNLEAVAYIKAKLESYGYTNVVLDPYTFEGETRHNIYATKMGTVFPTQMYIVSGHMDSFSTIDVSDAPGFDDDGSGTALVLELARVFAKARTDISVRFALWNNEETGLDGSKAYVDSHRALQGTLSEPTWIGVIQHDMILFDRFPVPDADVEYQANADFGGQAIDLANFVAGAMARYGTMAAQVSDNMSFTDSVSFQTSTASISVRENERVSEIGAGSNPNWHKPTDKQDTYTFSDIQFGFNIVKMTAGAVAELVNAEPDCNMNDIGDAEDIAGGTPDTNGDGVPDECQDCNLNGALDPIEIAAGTAADCNTNGLPDECDIAAANSVDCNANGVPDECEADCQPNGVPDDCDIADTHSHDCNVNTIPDECEGIASEPPQAEMIGLQVSTKNRFLSFMAGDVSRMQAVRVRFDSLPPPFDLWNGSALWVGPTSRVSESGANVLPTKGFPDFTAAALQCTPFFTDWSSLGTIHVFHEGIVPGGTYLVDVIDTTCDVTIATNFSNPLSMATATWGDTVLDLSGAPPAPPNGPPVDVVDALGVLARFSSVPDAIVKARADLEPACLDLKINVTDVLASLAAFSGLDYPFTPTAPDPCNSTCTNPLP